VRPAALGLRLRPVVLIGLFLAGETWSSAAERPWIEVRSPHFVVASNSGEGAARSILWQFEQIRAVVEKLWPWAQVDPDRPILVLAVRDEASMKALAPESWEKKGAVRPTSIFVSGPDRYYVALRTDVEAEDREGINPYVNSYWSYVGLVLASSAGHELPLWFHRGLTSVLSNTLVRKDGIHLGRVLSWHLQRLNAGGRLKLRELVTVDRKSPWYIRSDRLEVFDAQSWAFAHFLMFGEKGAHQQKLNRYASLLSAGKTPAAALEEALGNVDSYELAFADYSGRQLYGYAQLDIDVRIRREDFTARPLTQGEAAAASAAFHAVMRRPAEARALIDEARKSEASAAASYEVEGLLLDSAGQADAARAAFAKAVELDSKNFYPHYRLATIMWGTRPDPETLSRIEALLDRAAALNPRSAASFALLADARIRLDRASTALTPAHRAVAVDPGDSDHRLTLARVLWALSRSDEAVAQARTGRALAKTDRQRSNAQELLDFFAKNPRSGTPKGAGTTR
jgi:tetratricopeptide (TPR) repeat protein